MSLLSFGSDSMSPSVSIVSRSASSPQPRPRAQLGPESDRVSSPADDATTLSRDVNQKLIIAPSLRRRHPRQQRTLQLSDNPPLQAHKDFAISAPTHYHYHISRQDVRSYSVNASSTPPSTNLLSTNPNVFLSPNHPESEQLSSFSASSSHHVSLNNQHTRPRTSNQVFTSTSDLAAHYGIPQFLPPVPRTTPRSSRIESNSNISSRTPPTFDFNLCSNYLSMLSHKDDHAEAVDHSMVSASTPTAEAVQALVKVLQASPEFQSMDTFADYLTSPFEDSPFDDFLTTPVLESADLGSDMMTSPAIADYGEFGIGTEYTLFPEMDYGMAESKSYERPATPTLTVRPNFDDLLTMSPPTPSLDPSSVYPSPQTPATRTIPAPRRNMSATGTRKNITPDALVPVDAPTQSRKYVTPSATSRKEVPAVFARKRARSQAFGEEDDELEETITLPLNPTEAQLIEAKRRQNTIAARRSRKRKLEYTRQLEDRADTMQEERDMWKSHAMACEALLRHHGFDVPKPPIS